MVSFMSQSPACLPERSELGPMDRACIHCSALHFKGEMVARYGQSFNSCCVRGQSGMRPLPEPPAYIKSLLTDGTPEARHFRTHIGRYSDAMAFTACMYGKTDRLDGGLIPFLIHGELFHAHFPLEHDPGSARYAQAYLYEPEAASGFRFASVRGGEVRQQILRRLHECLLECQNPFIRLYQTAKEQLDSVGSEPYRLAITPQLNLVIEKGSDQRRTNLPVASEVALFIPDEYSDPCFRDIVLSERRADGSEPTMRRVYASNAAYLPLHYPLLFPYGTPGWRWSMHMKNPDEDRQQTKLTRQMWSRYHLFARLNQFSALKHARRLAQKFVVDAYAVVEQEWLDWLRNHQSTIRADLYQGGYFWD